MEDNFNSLEKRAETHPCFSPPAQFRYARIHLPVARNCNIQCRFCNRQYDCVAESRPGVTSRMITAEEVPQLLERVLEKMPDLTVAGIAGPGDPLANPEETFKTLHIVRKRFPDLILCLGTNGLMVSEYINEIVRSGVEFVTITINACAVQTAGNIYSWVKYAGKMYREKEGAELLLRKQLEGLSELSQRGVLVKVNTVLMPGINENEIVDLAKLVREAGANLINIMPLIPVEGSEFAKREAPHPSQLLALRKECGQILPSMRHCRQCRSDAIGLLSLDRSSEFSDPSQETAEIGRCSNG